MTAKLNIDKRYLQRLDSQLQGTLHYDDVMRTLYSTDASAYRELPLAVAFPKNDSDLKTLIEFADKHNTSLIPRTAGTSLAGQVVGNGIVVDVSRTFTKILEVNKEESWVRVQPGVVRDELNKHIASEGLFFGPETSTANRAMVGGMVGNNSCGSNSVQYGSTRDHLLEIKGFLSDGSEVTFKDVTPEEFEEKTKLNTLEGQLYKEVKEMLLPEEVRKEIAKEFPKPSIPRRNTGYAIDLLALMQPFNPNGKPFNFCELIAGSEGTLIFMTEIKLHCNPTPPQFKGVLCAQFDSIDAALKANLVSLKFDPTAVELMDKYILDCTKNSIEHRQNRFFLNGDPAAVLVTEIARDSEEEMRKVAKELEDAYKAQGMGNFYKLVEGGDVKRVWDLRKAGLGLLSNVPGDPKAAPVIEDTAVDVEDLPEYIAEFNEILKQRNLTCVHYAHAGSGELHLRPILDLKTEEGNKMFKTIAEDIAKLVKKFNGSLSGEHGDGRLRGEFIESMIGTKNFKLVEQVKRSWDSKNIFNPNKIVDTPPMNESLRFMPGIETPDIKTTFDFSDAHGVLRAAEFCNGAGACRKTEVTGGTMCPSYMATRNEKNTTRARANILREYLRAPYKINNFNHKEIYEVMDLCLSCKGCKSECPSNVDIAKLKAEFLQQYYEANGAPMRAKMIAYFPRLTQIAAATPSLFNFAISNPLTGSIFKSITGFAQERDVPKIHKHTFKSWLKKRTPKAAQKGTVYIFCDEFTNFNDTPLGLKTIELLEALGYEVLWKPHVESGRTFLSKGFVKEAKDLACTNVDMLKDYISEETPLIGIEPSTIMAFRDEYPDLVHAHQKEDARNLADNALMIDEFIAREVKAGNISSDQFTEEEKLIKLHTHCQQKATGTQVTGKQMLGLPKNYKVQIIPSGCCGMAGSFGYEKEHYKVSMDVGELVLFPTIRKQPSDVIIAAAGTSCRHQIKDGTEREALHPVEILLDALK
ncbi:FAD-binding and (Fe-S)-binding domain-containing protein [Flammeovirga kamogawensis]|uniref:FAD-binding protein n=1 Tax=Flammeovirga kamogawensis TaxID=373891 RepID=A0ABX8GZL3_9BACT|nr:FAD-binding and (Fe-S)-binding domain-containing protein [Flammeovirga kamogawensis]MBB6459503.1 FAD/FMN-containing dehydrogenase/Fe-S oxidoreductase [Flammeovirga kamogawensis]QWG09054.1 FAD-binding protein [Flammeovirga kamogawensis]TRX67343.1 FAD-binding protein [Flammeovirga kamogawensis]